MYVGVSEVGRILAGRTPYAQGDAHDTLWPKVVELLLVLPFILGYRTRAVCQARARARARLRAPPAPARRGRA